ncbi:MAG: response regulator [Gammaproteobacteria bacterium]
MPPEPTPHTVLLAEDDPHSARLAAEILELEGFVVERVSDGDTAWQAIQARPQVYDGVVLDRQMPRMTGMDILRRMKDDVQTQDIPVIFLTGMAAAADIVAGIEAGAYYYVTKPYDPDLLVASLRAAIGERRAHGALRVELESTVGALGLLREAEFRFRTPDEARALATLIANAAPEPRRVVTGLWELMLNAIEHGNLELSYAEKSRLLERGAWQDELSHRLAASPYRERHVTVQVERDADGVRYCICDEGRGFTPTPYLDFDPARATHAHGRGIAMARRLSFDAVTYLGAGNVVEARARRVEPATA